MQKASVSEIYESLGLEIKNQHTQDNGQIVLDIAFAAIPKQVLDEVKAAPLRGQIPVSDNFQLNEKIVRCDTLVFNPESIIRWHLNPNLGPRDFVAIATRRLVINFPNPAGKAGELQIIAPYTKDDLLGKPGTPVPPGWSSGSDDGRRGGVGPDGNPGQPGGQYNFPAIFLFYQEITSNTPIPAGPIGFRFFANGVDGGNGGKGGKGGTGGAGARGTPGSHQCVLFGCICSAGPGRGGDGGPGGLGGRGGDAARGGNGASVFIVGPQSDRPKLNPSEFLLNPGQPGTPGEPGEPGFGGQEGGGGSKPFECKDGGGSGIHGANATDTLGPGTKDSEGLYGAVFFSDRNNSDLF